MTPCFAVRREILGELMEDKEFAERLGKARESHEVINVIASFAEKKGYKVAEITKGVKR